MRLALLWAMCAACGSSPVTPPDAAIVDATETFEVTGSYIIRFAHNDPATHMPIVAESAPKSLAATAWLADGTQPAVTVNPDGTFAFTRAAADQPYRIRFVVDGGIPFEYQHTAAKLDLASRIVGRYDRVAAPSGTMLDVNVTGFVGGGATYVQTTGLWAQLGHGGSPSTFSVEWWRTRTLSGGNGSLDAAAGDRVYITHHENAPVSAPYSRIVQACSADVTTNQLSNPVSCALAATPMQCAHIQAHTATELGRLGKALAQGRLAYTTPDASWALSAISAPSLGPIAGLSLGGQGAAGTVDVDRNVDYSNPFPGHAAVLGVGVSQTRAIRAPGATTTDNLLAYITYVVPLGADCNTVTTDNAMLLAYPSIPTLDGVTLDNDALTLALDRTRTHDLAWSIAAPGTTDVWFVRLYEVSANSSAGTQESARHTWVATEPKVTIDPALLEAGKTYLVNIVALDPFPNAATGDFRTVGYPARPYAQAEAFSSLFKVTN